MFYLCRNVQLYALQSLVNIFAGCGFFSPARFFSLFSSHALSWQQLHSKLILTRCFVWILVGSPSHAEWFVAVLFILPPSTARMTLSSGKIERNILFLLDLIHLHFTWENCDDDTEFLPFSLLASSFSFVSIFKQLQRLPLSFLTPTYILLLARNPHKV